MKVELLYFKGCPSYPKTYRLLQEVLDESGISANIEQIEIQSEKDAERHRFYGSPSIRIDGQDLENRIDINYGFGCRVYQTSEGLQGLPDRVFLRSKIASNK